MTQKIQMEFTEQEARVVEYALERAAMVAPRQLRGPLFEKKLFAALAHVKEQVQGIPALPPARWKR